MSNDHNWWKPIWTFAVHALLGAGIFIVVAGVAVALNIAVKRLEALEISAFLIYGLIFAEYLLFAVDLLLFTIFVIRATRRAAKDL